MDFGLMKRKELQSLCKKNGIPANLTNLDMSTRLAALHKVKQQKMFKSCLKNVEIVEISENEIDKVDFKGGKRVRFSPENETFEFEKTDPRELRLLARKRRAMVSSRMVKNPVIVADDTNNVEDFGRKVVGMCEDVGCVEEPKGRDLRRRSVVISNAGFVAQDVENVVMHEKKETSKRNLRPRGKKTELKDVEAALSYPCVVNKPKRGRKGQEIAGDGVVERMEKPPDEIATRRSMRSRGVRAEKSNNVVKKDVNEKSDNVVQPPRSRRSARHVEKAEATNDLTSVSKGQVDDDDKSSEQDVPTNNLDSCVEMAFDSRKRKRVGKKDARGKHQAFEEVSDGSMHQQNINMEKPADSNAFVGRRLRGRKVVLEGSGKSDVKVLVDDCWTRKSLRSKTKNAEKDGSSIPVQAARQTTRRSGKLKSDASLVEQVTDDNVPQSTDHMNLSDNQRAQRAEVINLSMEARDTAVEKAEIDLTDHRLTEQNIGGAVTPESIPEVEEQCHVTLGSSPMEQKTETFDAQISTNSSQHLDVAVDTTKVEDSMGSNNSNETTAKNVEVNACSPLKSEALGLSLLNNGDDCEARCSAQAKYSLEARLESHVSATSDSREGVIPTPASIRTGKFTVSLVEEDCVGASESFCHYTTPLIPENCKSFDGEGTLSSYSVTDRGNGVVGSEKILDNKGDTPVNNSRNKELSKQENQLEESPGINKISKSENVVKNEMFVDGAAIVGEFNDQSIERDEVPRSEGCECVSRESECSRPQVSDGKGFNQFVSDESVAKAQRDVGDDNVLLDDCLTRKSPRSKTQNAENYGGSTPMQAARWSSRPTEKLKSDASPIEQVTNGNVPQITDHMNPNDNRRDELVNQLMEARDSENILEKADVVLTYHTLIEQNIGGGAASNNSLPANENPQVEEHCDVTLGSSLMKQNEEKYDTQIPMDSSQEFGTTKSEDSIGANKSNEKVRENVEAISSEPVCRNDAKPMIPENCKSMGGDGKLVSCAETDPEYGMIGSEKVIGKTGELSEQENQLEESPCKSGGRKSENTTKTNAAAIVSELDDQLLEKEEATGSRERYEYVSGESECKTPEVSEFVSDEKVVVGGEVNLEANAQYSIVLDGSILLTETCVVTVCQLMEDDESSQMVTPMGNLEIGTSSSNIEEPNMDEFQNKDGCKVMLKFSTVSTPLQSKVDGELRVLCSPMKREESGKETMGALSCFENDEFSVAKQLEMAESLVDPTLQQIVSEDDITNSNENNLLESEKAGVISDKDVDRDAKELSEKTKDLEQSFGKAAGDPKANTFFLDNGANPGPCQSLNPLNPGSIISSSDIKEIRSEVSEWNSVTKSVVFADMPEISPRDDDKGADPGDKSYNYPSDVMEGEMHKVSQVQDTNPSKGVEEMDHRLEIPRDSHVSQECDGLESMVDVIGYSPCKSAVRDETISKEFTNDIHNAPENTGREKLGEAADTRVTKFEGPCSSPFSVFNREINLEGVKGNYDRDQADAKYSVFPAALESQSIGGNVKGNYDRDQADAKYSVCPAALESQSIGGNVKVTDESEGPTQGASEVSHLPLLDWYVGISKVDVALKGNDRDVNNLEDASIVGSDGLAHGLGRPENLQSSPCGIAEVSDVLVHHEMLISKQVECNGDQGNSRIEQQNVNEEQLNSHVQEAADLVADHHLVSERPEVLQSLPCGGDGVQFNPSQVEHGQNESRACDADIRELQADGESMVIEHHDDNGNEVDSMVEILDASPGKLTIVDEAILDALLMPDIHDTPTGVEKLAEATSTGETDYEDVKSNHEANQAKAKDIACPPMVEPQSFGKDEKETNEIEEALRDAQEVARSPVLDESVGTIKDNVAQNESDHGVVEESEDACMTRSDDLLPERHKDLLNSSCGRTDVSVVIDDGKMNKSEELIANEDQGFNLASTNETVGVSPPMSPIKSRNSEAVTDMHDNLESTSGSKLFDVPGVKEMALSALCNHSFIMPNQETSYESCKENSESEVKEVKEASATKAMDGHSSFNMPVIGGVASDVLDDRRLSIVDHSIGGNNCIVNPKEGEHEKFVNSAEFGEGSHIAVEQFSKPCEMASESMLGGRDNNDDSSTAMGSFSPWPCTLENFTDQLPEQNSTESSNATSAGGSHLHESKELECNNVESCMFASCEIDLIVGDMTKDDNSSSIQQPVNEQTIRSPDCTSGYINVTSISDGLSKCHLSANNSVDITENVKDCDEIDYVDSKVMRSSTVKRKNSRSILIHGTPQKKPLFVHCMKENTVALKSRQVVDVTAVRPMVRRKALEDLQK